jgi:hypothetical protein
MAAAMLRAWESQGRPWRLCTPLVDMVDRLQAAYPQLIYGTLGDDAHLNAVPPEDHTPFSATGYPKVSPYPVVHALDVMHHPESGVDAGKLFAYWLGEAKAGRMPWLKYLIWQATIYDVRYGWRPQPSSGHFDHVHLSARTDAESTHLGDWSPIPPEDDMTPAESNILQATDNRVRSALILGTDTFNDTPGAGPAQSVWIVHQLNAMAADIAAIKAALAGGGSGPAGAVDLTDASVAKVAAAVADEEHARLAE